MCSPPVAFSYELVGTGWASATFSIDDDRAELSASYLADALGGLLAAVRRLIQGEPLTWTAWEEEPGEYRWDFVRIGDEVEVQILAYSDQDWARPKDEVGVVMIAGTVSLAALVTAIAAGARGVLDEHGPDDYLKRWVEHPFPLTDLEALELFARA